MLLKSVRNILFILALLGILGGAVGCFFDFSKGVFGIVIGFLFLSLYRLFSINFKEFSLWQIFTLKRVFLLSLAIGLYFTNHKYALWVLIVAIGLDCLFGILHFFRTKK